MRHFLNLFLLSCFTFFQYSYAQQYELTQELSLEGSGNARIEGSQAIVRGEGVAYVLEQQDHEWVLTDTLRPATADTSFGQSIAISNDQAIISANGTVYIYERMSDETWNEVQMLDNLTSAEPYAPKVAITENYAFASLNLDDGPNGEQWAGSVLVFQRTGSNWQQVQRLRASDTESNDYFGWEVEAKGNQLMVGNAVFLSETKSTNTAYIFTLNESGEWAETAKLPGFVAAEDNDLPTYSLGSKIVAIGSPLEANASGSSPGRVIIYEQKDGSWQQTTNIQASDAEGADGFGDKVVLYDNMLAAQTKNKGTYLYGRTGFGVWEETQILRDYYVTGLSNNWSVARGADDNTLYFLKKADDPSNPTTFVDFVPGQDFTSEKLTAAGQLKGNQAVVAGEGEAYIFEKQANDQWMKATTLTPPSTDESFGRSTAIANNLVAVGSNTMIYAFEKKGESWELVFSYSDPSLDENSFRSLFATINQDFIVISEAAADGPSGEVRAGTVVVFKRTGDEWQETQRLYASDGGENEFFGTDVKLTEDRLLVGNTIQFFDNDESTNAAYIFSLNESGQWMETAKLPGYAEFEGTSVPSYAFSPGFVAIGKAEAETADVVLPGEVIIYEWQNGTWGQSTVIKPSDSENSDSFGRSVVLYNNLLAVQTNSKGTYFYERTGFGKWEEVQILRNYYIQDFSDESAIASGPEPNTVYFLKKEGDDTPDPIAVTGFNLINPVTDQVIQPLQDGDILDLNAIFGSGDEYFLNIQAVTNPEVVGSVLLKLSGDIARTSRQNAAPYALFGDDSGDYRHGELYPGEYTLSATPYSERNFAGTPGEAQSISFTVTKFGQITGLTLINANREEAILDITEGTVIDYALYFGVNFNLRVDVSPEIVGSVGIKVSEEKRGILRDRIQNAAPYAAFGDNNGDYRDWLPQLGRYTVEATSYELRNRGGRVLDQRSFTFEVVNTGDPLPFTRTENTLSKSGISTEVQLYPNPVNDRLRAEVDHGGYFTLSIYNPMGQLVYQQGADTSLAEEINLSDQQPGIYMVVLNSSTERIVRKLMVKQ